MFALLDHRKDRGGELQRGNPIENIQHERDTLDGADQ